jgi:hypothetical protein
VISRILKVIKKSFFGESGMTERVSEMVKRILSLDIEDEEFLEKIDRVYDELLKSSNPESFKVLLELLSSGDVIHTQKAASILALKGNPKYLPEIKAIREKLPAHRGLKDYRQTVDKTIEILENIKSKANCRCNLYALQNGFSDRYNPYEEQKEGFISIVKEDVHEKEYYTDYYCVCNFCGRRWKVTNEIGYHYTLYKWEEITNKE